MYCARNRVVIYKFVDAFMKKQDEKDIILNLIARRKTVRKETIHI